MFIKTKAVLFRDLLYLREVSSTGKISTVAAKNAIKASNLSKILKDLEIVTGKKFFQKNSHGLSPTYEALKLSAQIEEIEQKFNKILAELQNSAQSFSLKLYKPSNMEIKDLDRYKAYPVNICTDIVEADVIISYESPKNESELIIVENYLQNPLMQTIWVSSKNTPQAIDLSRFIISQMHL